MLGQIEAGPCQAKSSQTLVEPSRQSRGRAEVGQIELSWVK